MTKRDQEIHLIIVKDQIPFNYCEKPKSKSAIIKKTQMPLSVKNIFKPSCICSPPMFFFPNSPHHPVHPLNHSPLFEQPVITIQHHCLSSLPSISGGCCHQCDIHSWVRILSKQTSFIQVQFVAAACAFFAHELTLD